MVDVVFNSWIEVIDSVCSGKQYVWHLMKTAFGPFTSFAPHQYWHQFRVRACGVPLIWWSRKGAWISRISLSIEGEGDSFWRGGNEAWTYVMHQWIYIGSSLFQMYDHQSSHVGIQPGNISDFTLQFSHHFFVLLDLLDDRLWMLVDDGNHLNIAAR